MNTATIITVAIMAVALVVVAACMIRLGYKALLAEWAIEAITKAEKEFVGTKLGEARLAVVVSWLRAKVPAPPSSHGLRLLHHHPRRHLLGHRRCLWPDPV